jgi:acylphosphatase
LFSPIFFVAFEKGAILRYNKGERMINMKKNKTLILHLEGMVQGVGMRFFIKQSASRYGVTGYVKNLRDGSVECLIQGDEESLDAFKLHIKRRSPGNISMIREEEASSHENDYHKFEVTF